MTLSDMLPCDLADRVDRGLLRLRTKQACWITFFLRLPVERRDDALASLERIGVEADRDGTRGRHLHGRLSINASRPDICGAIERVSRICVAVGAQILAADLDEKAVMGSAAQVANLFCTP